MTNMTFLISLERKARQQNTICYKAICYKFYIVYIDVVTMMIIGVLSFTITPISTFSGAFVSEVQ